MQRAFRNKSIKLNESWDVVLGQSCRLPTAERVSRPPPGPQEPTSGRFAMSLAPSRPAIGFVAGMALTALVIREVGNRTADVAVRTSRPSAPEPGTRRRTTGPEDDGRRSSSRTAAHERALFTARILRLLRICGGPAEIGIAAAIAGLLAARTAADLFVIRAQTSLEAAIVMGKPGAFGERMQNFVAAVLPISALNAVLKFALSELRTRARERLTHHLTQKWLQGRTFFLQSQDDRIAGVDQLITTDANNLARSVVDLYSNLAKPALDLVVFGNFLGASIGVGPPAGMLAYLGAAGAAMTWLRRPMSAFVANQARLEGEFRFVTSRVVNSSEMVAFMDGGERERTVVDGVFDLLAGHSRASAAFGAATSFVDDVVTKYGATAIGFTLLSRPFMPGPDGVLPVQRLAGSSKPLSQQAVSTAYYSSGRMLLNMSQAAGRLVSAGRELTRLSGHTSRVSELLEVLDDLESGHYWRTMAAGSRVSAMVVQEAAKDRAAAATGAAQTGAADPPAGASTAAGSAPATSSDGSLPSRTEPDRAAEPRTASATAVPTSSAASPGQASDFDRMPTAITTAVRARLRHVYGRLVVTGARSGLKMCRSKSIPGSFAATAFGDPDSPEAAPGSPASPTIRFEGCPVATPSGDVLLRSLTLEVPPGTNVLVAGPNGAGKSSMFRVLAGLWPLFGGTLVRPPLDELVYVPQSSFMPLGSLRDCVVYPLSPDEARDAGVTDDDVRAVLADVSLGHLVEREGLDTVRSWDEILSGGERQRLSFARVFLRKPAYAIVDEATSQVSVDVEAKLYQRCSDLGITLFSVSHRRSLWRFHAKILLLDGSGGYVFRAITEREQREAASSPGSEGDQGRGPVVFGS